MCLLSKYSKWKGKWAVEESEGDIGKKAGEWWHSGRVASDGREVTSFNGIDSRGCRMNQERFKKNGKGAEQSLGERGRGSEEM